jgi:transposase
MKHGSTYNPCCHRKNPGPDDPLATIGASSMACMLWIARTGAPWRDLPERYGAVGTGSSRFYRWQKAGMWDRIVAALQQHADATGKLDWHKHVVDGSTVRAHQHAAGANGGTQKRKRWGGGVVASPRRFTSVPKAGANR